MCESGILYEKCQIFNCHSLFCFLQHHMSWSFHFVRFWTQKGSCWSLQRGGRFYYKFRMGFVESGHMRELYIYMYILCENIFIPCSVNFSYLFCGILIQEIFFVLGRVPSKIIIEFDTYFFSIWGGCSHYVTSPCLHWWEPSHWMASICHSLIGPIQINLLGSASRLLGTDKHFYLLSDSYCL